MYLTVKKKNVENQECVTIWDTEVPVLFIYDLFPNDKATSYRYTFQDVLF